MKKFLLGMLIMIGQGCYANCDIGGYGFSGYQIKEEKQISGFGLRAEWQPNKYIGIFADYEMSSSDVKGGEDLVATGNTYTYYDPHDHLYYRALNSMDSIASADINLDLKIIYFGATLYPCGGTWYLDFAAGIPSNSANAKFSDGQNRSVDTSIDTPIKAGTGWKFGLGENVKMSLGINYNLIKTNSKIDAHGYYSMPLTGPELETISSSNDFSNVSGEIGIFVNF